MTTRLPGRAIDLATPVPHDWYREACEFLIGRQEKLSGALTGAGQMGENRPDVGTAFALLFLSHGRTPVAIARLQHHKGAITDAADWNHHRRALPNLVRHTGQQWGRELAWQTIDFSRWQVTSGDTYPQKNLLTAADLLEFPVLVLSGTQALDFDANQRRMLQEYVHNGGTLLAEACGDERTSAAAFDQSFSQLMVELFPSHELTKLPPEQAIWKAQQPIDAAKLPKDMELWGIDVCGCTSVFYCPRSLSAYWELTGVSSPEKIPPEVAEQIDQVTRLGCNVLTYATRRELKQRLDRPLIAAKNPGGRAGPDSLVIPVLRHNGDEQEPVTALNLPLRIVERQFATSVDYDTPRITAMAARAVSFTVHKRQVVSSQATPRRCTLKTDPISGNKSDRKAKSGRFFVKPPR